MKISISLFATLLALFVFTNCKKEKETIKTTFSWDCTTDESTLDSGEVAAKLIGRWDWEYIAYAWTPQKSNETEFKGLSIDIKPDGIIDIYNNDVLTKSIKWWISSDNSVGNYRIYTEPSDQFIYGWVKFCKSRIGFINSLVDGNDNYFIKR